MSPVGGGDGELHVLCTWGRVWAERWPLGPGLAALLQPAGRPGSERGWPAGTTGDSAGGRRTRLLDRNSHRLDMLPDISVTTAGQRVLWPHGVSYPQRVCRG